jgi:putative membrane protein
VSRARPRAARISSVRFVIVWLSTAIALWITTAIPGIDLTGKSTMQNALTLLAVALIFGLINAIIKPIIQIVGCALYVLTLGLFALVVNAGLFLLTGWLANEIGLPFHVSGFWPGFWGALIMSVVSFASQVVLPKE